MEQAAKYIVALEQKMTFPYKNRQYMAYQSMESLKTIANVRAENWSFEAAVEKVCTLRVENAFSTIIYSCLVYSLMELRKFLRQVQRIELTNSCTDSIEFTGLHHSNQKSKQYSNKENISICPLHMNRL